MPKADRRAQTQAGFCTGDIVITPTGRRAKLTHYRPGDGYWDGYYLDSTIWFGRVTLQPKMITMVDDERP